MLRVMKKWRWGGLFGLAVVVVSVSSLYWPTLSLELLGDDYHWVQHAHRALHRPSLLLADLDSFYRPASTWTLLLDRLFWPWSPAGYHATNLILHSLAAGLLMAAAGRLGLPWGSGVAVGWLWALSPWASESAIQVAIRFESLLLAAWCAIIAWWPRWDERWRPWRVWGVGTAVMLAAASKETWVITPALAWLLERYQARRRGRHALLVPSLLAALALVYSAMYFLAFPSDKGYFRWELATLAKIPQQLAGFFWLVPHRPVEFEFSLGIVVAVVATSALAWMAWRTVSPAMWVGLGVLLLPALPTLGVPFLPLRHCAAPYAGFLLLLAGALGELGRRVAPRWRVLATASALVALGLVGVGGALVVRSELVDAQRLSAAHRVVLEHAREVAWVLREGEPVLVVRADGGNVLGELAQSPRGWPKLLYARHEDPAALIDAAALFWWVRQRHGEDVVRLEEWRAGPWEREGKLMVYAADGFKVGLKQVNDVGATARALAAAGARLRVIELRSPKAY